MMISHIEILAGGQGDGGYVLSAASSPTDSTAEERQNQRKAEIRVLQAAKTFTPHNQRERGK